MNGLIEAVKAATPMKVATRVTDHDSIMPKHMPPHVTPPLDRVPSVVWAMLMNNSMN